MQHFNLDGAQDDQDDDHTFSGPRNPLISHGSAATSDEHAESIPEELQQVDPVVSKLNQQRLAAMARSSFGPDGMNGLINISGGGMNPVVISSVNYAQRASDRRRSDDHRSKVTASPLVRTRTRIPQSPTPEVMFANDAPPQLHQDPTLSYPVVKKRSRTQTGPAHSKARRVSSALGAVTHATTSPRRERNVPSPPPPASPRKPGASREQSAAFTLESEVLLEGEVVAQVNLYERAVATRSSIEQRGKEKSLGLEGLLDPKTRDAVLDTAFGGLKRPGQAREPIKSSPHSRFHRVNDSAQDVKDTSAHTPSQPGSAHTPSQPGSREAAATHTTTTPEGKTLTVDVLASSPTGYDLTPLYRQASTSLQKTGYVPKPLERTVISCEETSNEDSGSLAGSLNPGVVPPFHRVMLEGPALKGSDLAETREIYTKIRAALLLRQALVYASPLLKEDLMEFCTGTEPDFKAPKGVRFPPKIPYRFKMVDGVFRVWPEKFAPADSEIKGDQASDSKKASNDHEPRSNNPQKELKRSLFREKDGFDVSKYGVIYVCSRERYSDALSFILGSFVLNGPMKTYAHRRLKVLEARFRLHKRLNSEQELQENRGVPHRDFYNVRKIDNHVHHSACMNQKHLLMFIKGKLKEQLPTKVVVRNGKELTLQEVFESLNLTPYCLNVDTLDMHAGRTFHRFDKFNLKYNPIGEARLREIFLKYNNHIQGKYLAELTQEVLDDLETNKYQFAEYRLSIYGKSQTEWDLLAKWVHDNHLYSSNVRWMIQIPRLYAVYRKNGLINNLQEMIDNIFRPLFEVSIDPSSHPELHIFLKQVVGVDSVDDESKREQPYSRKMPSAAEWDTRHNPPYAMFSYYVYANLYVLNKLREHRGLTTFAYRPHAGEAGDVEHLAVTFLLARSINHGLRLHFSPPLQYLYFLAQVGISMSPLSNNLLFVKFDKNPFPRFFARGLNVTLSTDDPLMIHVTKEPLVEEYAVAAQVWKLSPVDMCEIARNSVLQSGFEPKYKQHWVSMSYHRRHVTGNDIRQTNVPQIRMGYRLEVLLSELTRMVQYSINPLRQADDSVSLEDFVDPIV